MDKHIPVDKKGVPAKIDLDFDRELEDISIARIKNDMEKDLLPKREVTRMIRNTEHWKDVKMECITKPRKR